MTTYRIRAAINMKRFTYILDNIELRIVKTTKYEIFTCLSIKIYSSEYNISNFIARVNIKDR